MKFITSLILTALLSFAACLFYLGGQSLLPHLLAVLIPQHVGKAFLTGFLALFILWGGLSFWISNSNEHLLAHKVSMLILKMDNPYVLMLATALIGALVAGFAALSGSLLKKNK